MLHFRLGIWPMILGLLAMVYGQDTDTPATISDPFALWPTVDSTSLATALNISIGCLDAMNASLPCDRTLLNMAGSVDNYWWEVDNLTQLCTNDCWVSVQAWDANVFIECENDSLVAYGKVVPASDVTGRYNDGMNIACLTNQNFPHSATDTDDDYLYCLAESQEWVGSDFIRPDCSVDPSDPSCADSSYIGPDDSRMANLYTDDVLCSECFVQMLYQRTTSQYLPDHDFSDYLIAQYQDILDVCNATEDFPELLIRAPPNYAVATPPVLNFTGVYTDLSCSQGQYITTSSLDPNGNCASIAQYFKVATGAVQAATNSTTCKPSTSGFCLPEACQISLVPSSGNLTCDTIASSLSTSNLTVTVVSLLNWNPTINGLCDSLTPDEFICAGPPGGMYIPPPPPARSNSDNNQQRGGNDGSSTGRFGNATVQCTSAQQPDPIQDGILSTCKTWCQAYPDDYCYQFAMETNMTQAQLYQWNPVLGSGGANCQTQFQTGYWYCVNDGSIKPTTTSSTPTKSTSTSTSGPSPTQSGISPYCNKYQIAKSGDYCYVFASNNNITTDELYTWNSILGTNGANCATTFQAGDYYCIGVALPSPTQSGIAKTCTKYQIAKAGDYCYVFAQDNGITADQLYAWNTILGANGANCQTQFQAGEYYCVGVSL
ncbi:hypothetical protein E4T43_03970 [Aureobasidium subglaciale]|nr:hypothetical protein E4T43_03970 [Aureobasidium subglaciale]